jgi:hypothetical protein
VDPIQAQQKEFTVSTFQAYPLYVPVPWNICLAPKPSVLRRCGCGCGLLRSRDVVGFGFVIVERVGKEDWIQSGKGCCLRS